MDDRALARARAREEIEALASGVTDAMLEALESSLGPELFEQG